MEITPFPLWVDVQIHPPKPVYMLPTQSPSWAPARHPLSGVFATLQWQSYPHINVSNQYLYTLNSYSLLKVAGSLKLERRLDVCLNAQIADSYLESMFR